MPSSGSGAATPRIFRRPASTWSANSVKPEVAALAVPEEIVWIASPPEVLGM